MLRHFLKGKRQETQSLGAEYQQRNDERSVNLLYIFKDLASNWDSFPVSSGQSANYVGR